MSEHDDRYVVMKADAMSRDPRRQRYDWHKRDIMPKCVVSLVRHWFPNPRGFPYICGNKTPEPRLIGKKVIVCCNE
jgi:hypothetical protein